MYVHCAACVALAVSLGGCASDADGPFRPLVDDFDRSSGAEPIPASRGDAPGPGGALPEHPTLADYLAYADAHHPAIEAGRLDWLAARQRGAQEQALPDPEVGVAYDELDERTSYGLSQTIPWPGKLGARAGVAEEEARAAAARYEARRRGVRFGVQEAYAEHAYQARALGVMRESRALVAQLEPIIAAQYQTAGASHADLLRAQLELDRIDDEIRALDAMRGPVAARLNAAIGRETTAPIPDATPLDGATLEATDEELLAWLREENPELRAMRFEVAGARRSIVAARRAGLPDVTVGVEYMREPEEEGVGASVSVSVPLWRGQYRAASREALARFGSALAAREDRRNTLEADLSLALYRLRDAERKIALYGETLLPKARRSVEAVAAGYGAGRAGFLDMIEARRAVLEFSLALERAAADHVLYFAEVELLVGRELGAGADALPTTRPFRGEGGRDARPTSETLTTETEDRR